jgi:hypothetical protein
MELRGALLWRGYQRKMRHLRRAGQNLKRPGMEFVIKGFPERVEIEFVQWRVHYSVLEGRSYWAVFNVCLQD